MILQENQVPDSIMLKLQKLKTLAEKGVEGEKENAKRLLSSLCKKYGIDEKMLFKEEKQWYEFEMRTSVKLIFLQLYVSIYGTTERYLNEVTHWKRGNKYVAKCLFTRAEYIEFSQLWEWHRKNYLDERKRMRELFRKAYIEKFKLYPKETCNEFEELVKDKKKDETTFEDIMAISALADACKDKTFYKQIESNEED